MAANTVPDLGIRPDSGLIPCFAFGLLFAIVAGAVAWAVAYLVFRPLVWTDDHEMLMPFAYAWPWFQAAALASTFGGGDSDVIGLLHRLDAGEAVHIRTLAVLYAMAAAACLGMFRQQTAKPPSVGQSMVLLDGVELITEQKAVIREANAKFLPLRARYGNGPFLAPGIRVDWSLAARSFNVFGAIGSGKTQWLMYYMSQILEAQQHGSNERIFLYDIKQEFYQKWPLPLDRVIFLSCKDARSDGWAIAKDLETIYHMREFCEVLIKSVNEGQAGKDPKWAKGAAEVVAGAMLYMQKMRHDSWSFCHIIQVLQSHPASLRGIMEEVYPNALQYCILNNDKTGWNETGASYFTDIAAMVKVLQMLDDAWGHLPKSRLHSIKAWVAGDGHGQPGDRDYRPHETRSLILGGFAELPVITSAFSSAFLAILTQRLKSLNDNPSRRVHLIVDEAKSLAAGFADNCGSSIEVGRSKGLSMVLCWQTATQILSAFSDADAKTLVSLTATSVILQQNVGEGADFLVKQLLGRKKTMKPQWSKSMGPQVSYSINEQTHEEECVMPTALTQDLAAGYWPDFGDGFRAILVGTARNPIRVHYDFSFSWGIQREQQILADWTRAPRCLNQQEREALMAKIQAGVDRTAQPNPLPQPSAAA